MKRAIPILLMLVLAAAVIACGGNKGTPEASFVQPAQRATATPGQAQADTPAVTPAPVTAPQPEPPPPQPLPPAAPTEPPVDPSQPDPTETPQQYEAPAPAPGVATEVVGPWRIYSARIYYDEGGGGDLSNVITTQLELSADGTWYFGSSSGTWSVEDITADDWARWGVDAYGPARRMVLYGWNGGTADGPMEESTQVDFIWVIYPEGPPTISAPGTAWMKFGHP